MMSHAFRTLAIPPVIPAVFAMFTIPSVVANDQPSTPAKPERQKPGLTVTMKTLGGRQFWGDLRWYQGWRIQQHVVTKHCRLLDPEDYRHESGTLEECEQKLADVRMERELPPLSGRAVVVVHGIIRSSKSFTAMKKKLGDEGFSVVDFDYPSTRVEIEDSSEYLHSVMDSLDGFDEINFVVHSMGGLLVRAYLNKHRDERIKRMVMLGVPNMGARMADMFKRNPIFRAIFGPAGQQLVTDPEGMINSLPTPDFEFGIIAGGRGNLRGFNPLIPGDDDATVSVASTRLPGASDFILINAMHSFMMFNADVIDATSRYLLTGRFREDGDARPIEKEDEESSAGDDE